MNPELSSLFEKALVFAKKTRPEEYDLVDTRRFEDEDTEDFLFQYTYVVFHSGMKYSIAMKMFEQFEKNPNATVVSHPGKRKAIQAALQDYGLWFAKLKEAQDKIAFLATLPYLGPITKFHLARNLGIDCCKPDRHLVRLALAQGYICQEAKCTSRDLLSCKCQHTCVTTMCQELAEKYSMRVGTIDFVLWAYAIGFDK